MNVRKELENGREIMAKKKRKKNRGSFNRQDRKQASDLLVFFMAICPFLLGLCKQYLIFGAALVALSVLIFITVSAGKLVLYKNSSVAAGIIMLASAGISVFAGISHGDSFYGFVRLMAAGVWILLLMQLTEEDRRRGLSILPSAAVFMLAVCAGMYLIPEIRGYVFANNRLAGLFQYSNTMALFLLIALIIFTLNGKYAKAKWKRYAYPVILLVGILWTGSRTTFVMTVIVMLLLSFFQKEIRRQYLLLMTVGIAGAACFAVLFQNTSSIGRFLTIIGQSSTLIGRILYWTDGLEILTRHPMGVGYMGFFFMQQSVQSGVYTVRYLHNEWLQMALDYGVIFLAAFIYLFIHQMRKSAGVMRWILAVIGIHMVMDFDLQYMSMVWLFLSCMDWQEGKRIELLFKENKSMKGIALLAAAGSAGVFLWLGIANLCYETGAYDVSAAIYPWSVETREKQMISAKSVDEAEKTAKALLKLNPYDAAAYDMLALVAQEEKEYMDMIHYKKEAVKRQKYRTEEYEDYVVMLRKAISYYEEKDSKNYQTCVEELLQVEDILEDVEKTTSPLAYRIYDKPELELSEKSLKYIEQFQ